MLEKAKDKLKDVPRDELVEKMVKLQGKLAEKEKRGQRRRSDAQGTEVVARDLTKKWVERQSREASEAEAGKGRRKK